MVDTSSMLSRRRARRKQAAPATCDTPEAPRRAAYRRLADRPAEPAVGADDPAAPHAAPTRPRARRTWRQAGPLLLLRAAHPKQALLTAAGVAAAAALAGRPARELGLVFVTVLVGQAIVGWHNDLVDRDP